MYGWKNSLIRGLGFICYDNKSPVMHLQQLSENDWKSLKDEESSLSEIDNAESEMAMNKANLTFSPKNLVFKNGPQFENSPVNIKSQEK